MTRSRDTADVADILNNDTLFLKERTAPSTAASQGALYTKDTSGQPELFYREESDGNEVQLTSAGSLNITLQVKAWAHVTISGGTPSIADSFNVSSIDDDGVGDFGINFTTAFANTNYGMVMSAERQSTGSNAVIAPDSSGSKTTGAIDIRMRDDVNNAIDGDQFTVAFVGDQ